MTRLWIWLSSFWKSFLIRNHQCVAEPVLEPEIEPVVELVAEPVVVEPVIEPVVVVPVVEPVVAVFPTKRAKWVKPQKAKPKKTESQVAKPKAERKPSVPRPATRQDDDPEQWGQFYFRDAILDQLDTYFMYLKRMKRADKEAYEQHRRLGIHLMPQSAIKSFDNWREKNDEDELSAWWKTHRPSFGAVAYGIDSVGTEIEHFKVVDASPEQWKKLGLTNPSKETDERQKGRLGTISKGVDIKFDGELIPTARIWVPKFLYFMKWAKVPADIQQVTDGDVYSMTVYWDRVGGFSKGYHKRHKGGIPQQYAVCVEKETGKVRVLRSLMNEQLKIQSKKEPGGSFKIPHKRWGYPTEQLNWASGRLNMSPEDYLRRCFMEAALMYESAALGSMIRITATKGKLAAAFGVEIKRTAYFFKDRETVLNAKGSTARIFHIVRPHVRKNGTVVPLHFRGLKEFEWAGHKIKITVPGLDHFHLTEFDVGSRELKEGEKQTEPMLDTAALGDKLNKYMDEGLGAWPK
jgi:hypothetical protein